MPTWLLLKGKMEQTLSALNSVSPNTQHTIYNINSSNVHVQWNRVLSLN